MEPARLQHASDGMPKFISYLGLGDGVCGQFDDGKVPLAYRTLDLIISDLRNARCVTRHHD
jgi:hypothetical protein